jgi:hypothetical protein
MTSDESTILIVNKSVGKKILHVLYVDEQKRGAIQSTDSGHIRMVFYPCGPCQLNESINWLQGMLDLSVIGKNLQKEFEEAKHAKSN